MESVESVESVELRAGGCGRAGPPRGRQPGLLRALAGPDRARRVRAGRVADVRAGGFLGLRGAGGKARLRRGGRRLRDPAPAHQALTDGAPERARRTVRVDHALRRPVVDAAPQALEDVPRPTTTAPAPPHALRGDQNRSRWN
ncbi:hypothetical protein GCM10010495_65400 [Kitasatospora herbaricolor]|nr:hypothetical protein GCM10010495_65400 [Kitasatospora herbaricolor]